MWSLKFHVVVRTSPLPSPKSKHNWLQYSVKGLWEEMDFGVSSDEFRQMCSFVNQKKEKVTYVIPKLDCKCFFLERKEWLPTSVG